MFFIQSLAIFSIAWVWEISNLIGIIGFLEERIGTKVRLVSGFMDKYFATAPNKDNVVDFTNAYAITLREEKK